ncbi:unnamed protein product [Allacma fusca]|uniref:Uncharacterized protein n=1 Tax=Allacma fusca TaxID=39272 RepID=A0A8J2NXJ1_9HEXA|nr:unnamed protein product [Allacma fusca]
MVRLASSRTPVLTDITDRGLQIFDERVSTPRMNTRTVTMTPSTPERVPTFESTPSAVWSPVTPPSTGRYTRSRSSSFSPRHLSFPQPVTPLQTASTSRIRASPRKRILVGANDGAMTCQFSPKKLKIDLQEKKPSSFMTGLLALNSDQLISLIGKLVGESDDEANEKLVQLIPTPDLKHIDKEMRYLRAAVNKSVANRNSRFVSKTDAVAFTRAQVHLQNFKKYLTSTGIRMTKSEQWSSVVKFVILAWNHARLTPKWDKPYHNDIKAKCFKFLSNQLIEAIKKGKFSSEDLSKISDQASLMLYDSETIRSCILLVNNLNCSYSPS